MAKGRNILTIGDIHGRSTWKSHIFGGETEYFFWRNAIDEGYLQYEDRYSFEEKWDKIIFVGDYCDSFTISNSEILQNLEEIVLFAKTYPDLVVLLLGNHDIQYIVKNEICSGYRGEMQHDLYRIFEDNRNLFRLAYMETLNKKPTLWTHAGVTRQWYKGLISEIRYDEFRYADFFSDIHKGQIDEILNMAWNLRMDCLFDVDRSSGGTDEWAGPIWVRPEALNEFNLPGYNQIVGHTQTAKVKHVYNPPKKTESNPLNIDTITYVDCLEFGYTYHLKENTNEEN